MKAKHNRYRVFFVLFAVLIVSCNDAKHDIYSILQNYKTSADDFITPQYQSAHPLAQLINPPNYSDQVDSFTLDKAGDVKIYAVGEINFNMPDQAKKYYLGNDGVELFFASDSSGRKNEKYFWISLKSKKSDQNSKVTCIWKLIAGEKYIANIRIPLSEIPLDQGKSSVGFNIAVADNDDGLVQKAKIAWRGKTDEGLAKALGTLNLDNKRNTLPINKASQQNDKQDTISDNFWLKIPPVSIDKKVYGFVKDRYDLSGYYRYFSDGMNLYIRVEVFDSRQKQITLNKLKDRQILVDYGWIEDNKGKRIWEMNAKFTKYAGGGFKNQKADTVLHLPAGKFSLHYVTDESHAYEHWTEKPPTTPFYGIVVYQK